MSDRAAPGETSLRSRRAFGWRALVATLLATALGGCAAAPTSAPADTPKARQQAFRWEAARECQTRFPSVTLTEIDPSGRPHVALRGTNSESAKRDSAAFSLCYTQLTQRKLQTAGLVGTGQLSSSGRGLTRTSLPIGLVGNAVIVSVAVNGHPVTMLVDTGATMSMISPETAERIGAVPPPGAITQHVTGLGGRVHELPVTRVRALALNEYAVEDLDVVVLDALPGRKEVQGLLGYDVLRYFRVTFDREARQLVLEPVRQPVVATGAEAGPPVAPPSWSVGDEWTYRWETPQGSGTLVWWVSREEEIEGQPYWVMEGANQEIWHRKRDLAVAQFAVGKQLQSRNRPPHQYVDWPLSVGKAWERAFEEERPATRETRNVVFRYHVEAAETVTVPAGTFRTLKIVRRVRSGAIVTEFWYSPEVRHWVRVREALGTSGTRTQELIAYRLQPGPRAAR
jgi:hypothetical protein